MALIDRIDHLITRGLLLVVAVAAPVLLVGLPLVDWVRGEPLATSGDTGSHGDLGALVHEASGAQLTWAGEADVSIADAAPTLWLTVLVPASLLAVATASVALLLRHVVGQIETGRPFTASSLRALRAAGVVVVAASVTVPLVSGWATARVMDRALTGATSGMSFTFQPLWLLAGVLVVVLAEAFRTGIRLTDDVDGLV